MANDTQGSRRDKNTPMPIGKAIGGLLLLYALIGGPAIWRIRRNCLLQHEDCDYYGLLEWVLSDRLSLFVSIMFLSLLLFLTWQFIGLARDGKLGIEEDPPEPKYNVSGLLVALVVFFLYLGVSLAVLMSATNELGQFDDVNPNIFVWKFMGPLFGSGLVWMTFWHINDYFVKPASNVVLLLLFSATFGLVYFFAKFAIGNF